MYYNKIRLYVEECRKKREELGNLINRTLDKIRDLEKQVHKKKYSHDYEIENHFNYLVETSELKRKIEEEEEMKENEDEMKTRYPLVNTFLSVAEMSNLENQMERFFSRELFNSDIHQWSLHQSEFYDNIKNKSRIFFLFETMDNKRFGCYINAEINCYGKYISDPNTIIFNFEGKYMEHYPVKDIRNAIRIGNVVDDDLLVIGKNDIVIKKKEKKRLCYFKYFSSNSIGKLASSFGKREFIEIKRFSVFSTMDINERIHKIQQKYQNQRWIENWSGLSMGDILFDSNNDDWNINTSVLNDRIIGKKQLLFIIEEEDGEKFGYYLNTPVIEKYGKVIPTDEKSFLFNLESNGRFEDCMKYPIKHLEKGGYQLYQNNDEKLISLGAIHLKKQNEKQFSFIFQFNDWFEYHGLKDALCSKTRTNLFSLNDNCFIMKQLLVIQMN